MVNCFIDAHDERRNMALALKGNSPASKEDFTSVKGNVEDNPLQASNSYQDALGKTNSHSTLILLTFQTHL